MADAFNPFDGEDTASFPPYWDHPSLERMHAESWNQDSLNDTLNTTFESDLFEFSATEHVFDPQAPLFPDDPMSAHLGNAERNTIHVALHEQLTSHYDGSGRPPCSQVEGYINVRSSGGYPFRLVVRDRSKQMESFREDEEFCIMKGNEYDDFLGDKVLQVTLPVNGVKQRIASYVCSQHVRPIPMLVKSKVVVSDQDRCRVGVKIRSNPANASALENVAILLAVPPDIRGETVKLTRQGGVWDGMKRVVAWSVDRLLPGELIEIQAQFQFVVKKIDPQTEPKFPVLVRCDAMNEQFSKICLILDSSHESFFIPAKMNLSRSVRVVHRKV